ncbi:HD domain-containing phosphohydrolase [Alishewanella sp. d11]|uniref:HD domain-containing phosphohydrolase n=1 Tax=Alishewanella sp. d11 TaxID=3414030 RepID=UPI003BF8DA92
MHKKRVPIHIHISTLFIGLFLLFAVITGWFNHQQTTEIFTLAAEDGVAELSQDIKQEFSIAFLPVATAVGFLTQAEVTRAQTESARLSHLGLLADIIKKHPQLDSLQVAYADGASLIVRHNGMGQFQQRFGSAAQTHFVVDHIEQDEQQARVTRYFFDTNLTETQAPERFNSDYDARERPWYVPPSAKATLSKPYLFYFLQQVGVTISQANQQGVVIAANVTLSHLSELLARVQPFPSTELLLTTAQAEVVAYHNIALKNNLVLNANLPTIADLKVPLFAELFTTGHQVDELIRQKVADKQWIGKSTWLDMGEYPLLLTVFFLEQELLQRANTIRQHNQLLNLALLVMALPLIWWTAQRIAVPIQRLAQQADRISHFDFAAEVSESSRIKEIADLQQSMQLMKRTIGHYNTMITAISAEKDFEKLMQLVVSRTREVSRAQFASLYLLDENSQRLQVSLSQLYLNEQQGCLDLTELLLPIALTGEQQIPEISQAIKANTMRLFRVSKVQLASYALPDALDFLQQDTIELVCVPLVERGGSTLGVLLLGLAQDDLTQHFQQHWLSFIEAISGFSGLSLENRQLIQQQKALLESVIQLIASAIDAKSPYTAGHCQRVPELTKMLAQAACDNQTSFKDFQLSEAQWEELHFASWLHDCGKVTTPEYVVDKATKLETLYDRIHEIRMRFEVLKRDAEITCLKAMLQGGDATALQQQLTHTLTQLDEDFVFVAECNLGGEFMAADKIERLQHIAEKRWLRTLSDRIGISWEEAARKSRQPEPQLPVSEPLLADKPEHIIERTASDNLDNADRYGFQMTVPQYKYQRGELVNLSITRGTLTEEERYKINEHIMQTIIMLEQLPYPKHLRNVPIIAGGHHEKMDGTGYPRRLQQEQMPLTARMMAIADIFEALTAADRPYKKAKTLSEAIKIMSFMQKEQHIDGELFRLFLTSGVYKDYAEKFLHPSQIDEVSIADYL